jgi:hypothetical protein
MGALQFIQLGEKISEVDRPLKGNDRTEKKVISILYPKAKGYKYSTVWDTYAGAWIAANPVVSRIVANWDNIARGYGRRINNDVHNAREYYEYQVNEISRAINKLLVAQIPAKEKRKRLDNLTRKQANTARLLQRTQRLYYWNPEEIGAFREQTIEVLSGVVKDHLEPAYFEWIEQFTGVRPSPVGFREDVIRAFQHECKSLKLWLPWLIVSILSLGLSLIGLVSLDKHIFGAISPDILAYPLSGLIVGVALGLGQWIVMRPRLEKPGCWMAGTAIGFALCFALLPLVHVYTSILFANQVSRFVISALLLGIIGILQSIALRRRARRLIELWGESQLGPGKLYSLDDFEKYGLEILEKLRERYGT